MEDHLIIETAQFAVIQDCGRYGYEQFGVTNNGAVDMYAYLMGNKLVGNVSPQPSIEIIAFDFVMSSNIDVQFCVTGAPADITIDTNPIEGWKTTILPAGKKLSIKKIRQGLRTYISFKGGIETPIVLGSSSYDAIAKIGERLFSGQTLRVRCPDISLNDLGHSASLHAIPCYGSPWNIRICDGPDIESFANNLELFFNSVYTVSPQSNHIGIRLDGPSFVDFELKEVLSRGVAIGAIEIIPTGQPIILHRGRTLTAGYPVIGVVSSVDLGMIGQARPGDKVRFSRITVDEAEQLYRVQLNNIAALST